MKTQIICMLFTCFSAASMAQYQYEPNKKFPFGQANPSAPKEIKDFEPMIGKCLCKSTNRAPDGSWAESVDMIWTFEYIMNGMAVQDKTLKADGKHSGSIRQYDADSAKWFVHYYSSPAPGTSPLSYWTGNREENKIVLYRPQKSPQGYDGFARLTFYDFTDSGYKWIGEWVDVGNTIIFPFWKIECQKK